MAENLVPRNMEGVHYSLDGSYPDGKSLCLCQRTADHDPQYTGIDEGKEGLAAFRRNNPGQSAPKIQDVITP